MLAPERFREVMALWPSGVTVVAFRDERRVVATTATAFLSLSLDPPRILVALGPNATVRPFLTPDTAFGLSVLTGAQRRLATIFADPYPVGAEVFPPSGVPLIEEALIGLGCAVVSAETSMDHLLVIADVRTAVEHDAPPLIRYRRRYHVLDG